jgi:hypothetical protein
VVLVVYASCCGAVIHRAQVCGACHVVTAIVWRIYRESWFTRTPVKFRAYDGIIKFSASGLRVANLILCLHTSAETDRHTILRTGGSMSAKPQPLDDVAHHSTEHSSFKVVGDSRLRVADMADRFRSPEVSTVSVTMGSDRLISHRASVRPEHRDEFARCLEFLARKIGGSD